MITKELVKEVKVTQAITVTNGAAGTSAINGVTLDMANCEGVIMKVTFGAIVSGAVTSIKAQQGALSNMSDAADLQNTGMTIADTDDEKTFLISVHKPRERYVRLVVSRATQNATVASAEYWQYGCRTLPNTTHGSNVTVEAHVSPEEGTA